MRKGKISLVEAIAMAVGTMIGASIFSIFGVGVQIAGRDLPWAFVVSGVYAAMVAYSYGKMGSKIVSNAGPIAFILKGLGDSPLVGTLSILMWLSFVVSISLFASGFAGYFLPLIGLSAPVVKMGVEVLVIALFGSLNYFGGAKAVGKAEFWIVMVKLTVLGVFIVAGFTVLHPGYLKPDASPTGLNGVLAASIIFFLSYMGFGLVTNASENMKDPQRNVPRAIYISIVIVMIVYIGVSVAAVGALPMGELQKFGENALAVAAEPALGQFGFLLLSIGALFSISSALNATLYGGANVAYALMKDGELPLPEEYSRKEWFSEHLGLYLTAVLGMVFALFFDIGEIASMTSLIMTVIYIFVLYAHLLLAEEVGGHRGIVFFNLMVISLVAIELVINQWHQDKPLFFTSLGLFVLSYALEVLYYRRKRQLKASLLSRAAPR
ncbi:MAG TPA: amino acid permease [Chloroflexi bacterium]|nr:amino acid permease [Chloroflexota bacterium]